MKICLAQARPISGDVQANIINHKKLIALAAPFNPDLIVFPELSVTGYEPKLANDLAMRLEDYRLDDFQRLSDQMKMTIACGLPLQVVEGILISLIIFRPQVPRSFYSKKYLHLDEEPYFIRGSQGVDSMDMDKNIALAICYEISIEEHADDAAGRGATIYLASADKTTRGIKEAIERLATIGKKYSMTVLLANCAGTCDGGVCGGKSSIWNKQGVLIGQLEQREQGILMIDTKNDSIIKKWL